MGSANRRDDFSDVESTAIHHPACPNCGVKMWLIKIDHFAGLPPESDRQHFECKACGASAVLPPL